MKNVTWILLLAILAGQLYIDRKIVQTQLSMVGLIYVLQNHMSPEEVQSVIYKSRAEQRGDVTADSFNATVSPATSY